MYNMYGKLMRQFVHPQSENASLHLPISFSDWKGVPGLSWISVFSGKDSGSGNESYVYSVQTSLQSSEA